MIIQPREMAQVMENFLFWPSRKLTHRGHKVITQKVCGGGKFRSGRAVQQETGAWPYVSPGSGSGRTSQSLRVLCSQIRRAQPLTYLGSLAMG